MADDLINFNYGGTSAYQPSTIDFSTMFSGDTDIGKIMSYTSDNNYGLSNSAAGSQIDFSGLGQGVSTGIGDSSSNWMGNISQSLNLINNLVGGYTSLKQLGLSKDSYKTNKALMLTNLSNQANLTNAELATAEATRLRSQGITGDANDAAVAEFMSKYGVSGTI